MRTNPVSINDLFGYIQTLMLQHGGIFVYYGVRMFTTFAAVRIVWVAILAAYSSYDFNSTSFVRLAVKLTGMFLALNFYDRPIYGWGYSFSNTFVVIGQTLANNLNANMVGEIMERSNRLYLSLEPPGLGAVLNIVDGFIWAILVLFIAFPAVAVFWVISFGYIATAICVIVGPVLLPWMLIPGMEWLAWGWIKSIIQYVFYGVVANAYIFVFGNFLIHYVDQAGTDFSGLTMTVLFYPLLAVLGGFTLGIFQLPRLTAGIISGQAGQAAFPPAWR